MVVHVPPPRVLLHVKVGHRRLLHLLVGGAALDAVIEREIVLSVVERALEAEAHEVDEEAEQRDVERAAQPLVDRQQPEHRHVAHDEGDGHEVTAEELDRGAGRGVEHLSDPDGGLEQWVHGGEEDPKLQRRIKVVASHAAVRDVLPL